MCWQQFALGIIAGEGCFYIGLQEQETGSVSMKPSFSLVIHEKEVLEKLQSKIGGEVYDHNDDSWSWQIQSIRKSESLSDFIDSNKTEWFESTKKHEQYKQWKRAVLMMSENLGETLSDNEKKEVIDIAFSTSNAKTTRKSSKNEWYQKIDEFEQYTCSGTNREGEPCTRTVYEQGETCYWH